MTPPDAWPRIAGIAFGGDYNPEQWPKSTWPEDRALMREAGVSVVTVGVFAWSYLEPRPGEYDTRWLHEVIDGLHEAGIAVDLATATASPPPWLTHRHPEVMPVDRRMITRWPGGRQGYCPSSPIYRDHALALVDRLALEFADHPGVVLWHVNNEYGCHTTRCYCDASAAAFRTWLQARYGTLDELNRAWGTSVWSQRFSQWEEILPPRISPDGTAANPSMSLDFARFSSDALLDLFIAEKEAIRQHDALTPITTNFMSMQHITGLDYWRWADHVDIISTDHYTIADDPDRHIDLAFQADRTRGLAAGRPWLLMEHSPGAVNWQPRNRTKPPGEMLRDSLAHIAHGADGTLFFQWRAAVLGSERFHAALLPHAGTDSARWRETVQLGETIQALAEVAGSRVLANVALLWDFESVWALQEPNLPSVDLQYEHIAYEWYRTLWNLGVTVDVVGPHSGLDGYDAVLVPMAYLMDEHLASRLTAAVRSGANVLVSYFSGVATRADSIVTDGYLGVLAPLLGVRVEEFAPLLAGESAELSNGWSGRHWSEVSRSTGADVLARFTGGPAECSVALSRHDLGSGSAWYVATHLDDWSSLMHSVLTAAGVPVREPADLELVERRSAEAIWTFAINHGRETTVVRVAGRDVISGDVASEFEICPGQVRVIRQSGNRPAIEPSLGTTPRADRGR